MASIRTLKDSNNEAIYPQTLTNAIFNLDNQTLDNLLALKASVNEVYSKDEVNNIISTLSSLKIEAVEELPTIGSTDTIYLVPKADSEEQNTYDEYIYLENGTYEKIGDTTVDLSNFYTKTETDAKYAKASLYGENGISFGLIEGEDLGVNGTAEGSYNWAGTSAHAEGTLNRAGGDSSHAEGVNTYAIMEYSHTEGAGTIAHAPGQHVQGKYNIDDTEKKYAHIVGNGTDDEADKRSNAHTLDWSGNSWYQGNIKCGGTSYDDAPNSVVTSGSVVKMWTGTQTEYDAIETKDSGTLYLITAATEE